jgi:uncharacterized protein (TIGR03000 family)
MYRSILSVLAGLLAAAAFAVTPGTALAQHHGGHGGGHAGHVSSGWHGGGGGWHGGGWHDGGWGHRGWGWGGVGIGIGLGYPWYGYGSRYYGYGYSPYYYGDTYTYSPYYYGDTGSFYDTTPYYYGSPSYDYSTMPAYGDMGGSGYAYGSTADNAARVRVMVPPDAKVWFNDRATRQTGSERDFETPALQPGRDFTYDVKAQWRDQNGKEVTQTRHVDVRANSNVTVDFMRQ